MPEIGEIKRGLEIGRVAGKDKWSQYIWHSCRSCGKERWVKIIHNQPRNEQCRQCNLGRGGSKNPQWKGGKRLFMNGYIDIWISPESPFSSMAKKGNYIREHRLVMAQYLGRCLLPWEIVHHKGTKYPMGSKEDKGDNRIENLQLTTNVLHREVMVETIKGEEQKRILDYLKLLLEVNPKASLASTIDLIESTKPAIWGKG